MRSKKKEKKQEEQKKRKEWVRSWFILELESPGICKRVRGKYSIDKIHRIKQMIKDQSKYMIWTTGEKEWSLLSKYKIKGSHK